LRANIFYLGNYRNRVGELRLGDNKEIQSVAVNEALPKGKEGEMRVLEKLSLMSRRPTRVEG